MKRLVCIGALWAIGCGATDSANPFESTGGEVSAGASGGQAGEGEGAAGGNGPAGGGAAGGAPTGTGATASGGSGGAPATGGVGGVTPGGTGGTLPGVDAGGAESGGTGGVATGGSATGGALPTGGSPDAGTSMDAGGAAGADASTDGSTPADAGAPSTMRCGGGSLTCNVDEGQFCCASFTGYECLSSGSSTRDCGSVRACDSQDDCPGSQVCCAEWTTGGFTDRFSDFTCVDSCEGSDAVIECRSRSDCPDASFCCGNLTGNDSRYAELTCETSCADETICNTVDDCPDPGNEDCVQDDILPTGFGRCVPD